MAHGLPVIFALGMWFAAGATAQQSAASPAPAARIAEVESRIAQLTQQLHQLRATRLADEPWVAPHASPLTFHAPASSLQRTLAVGALEVGCPQGAVCLMVRCDAPPGR